MIGHPDRKYLWVLSRTPVLDEDVYREIVARVRAKGYDLAPLKRTLQPPGS